MELANYENDHSHLTKSNGDIFGNVEQDHCESQAKFIVYFLDSSLLLIDAF